MSSLPFGPSARHPSSFILALPVSIAFRRFGPLARLEILPTLTGVESPLPFGVLAPWLLGYLSSHQLRVKGVSIAFRRFGPLAQPGREIHRRVPQSTLHCLSAFWPPGSRNPRALCLALRPGLHCLSAFWPPGSWGFEPLRFLVWQVSIAFRRFGPLAPKDAWID